MAAAGPTNSLLDVPGLLVGGYERTDPPFLTGTTAVLFPDGAVAGVDVRGGGPGTRETDLLDPGALVERVHAIVLSGGSAYGLDAAGGVMRVLEERRIGFPVGAAPGHVVPIVPAAVLYDLGRGGDPRARPDADWGARAAAGAASAPFPLGNVGAGTGAIAGGLKGGLGSASEELPSGVRVAALAAVNSAGEVADPDRGTLYGADFGLAGEFERLRPPGRADRDRAAGRRREPRGPLASTTLGLVVTDAVLAKAEARKMAAVAHDGLARAIRPAHGYFDGDTVFAAATGRVSLPVADSAASVEALRFERAGLLDAVFEAAARALARSVVHAVLAASGAAGVPCYRELYPSALAGG